jgi:hypothetical protein
MVNGPTQPTWWQSGRIYVTSRDAAVGTEKQTAHTTPQPTPSAEKFEETGETPNHCARAIHHTGRQARCCTIPTSVKAGPHGFSRCQNRNRVDEKIYCSPRPTHHRQVLTVGVFLRVQSREGQEWQRGRPGTADIYNPPGQARVPPGRKHTV